MNIPVNFQQALALKEKGFEQNPVKHINQATMEGTLVFPTISEVVMWLYEKYSIWVSVNTEPESGIFYFSVDKNKGDFFYDKGGDYPSPTKAYEAAIEYTLKNLVP